MRPLNFVRFGTVTAGTGSIAVGAAVGDHLTPAQAGIADGARVPYVIDDGTDWAFGIGVYSTTGPTLARDAAEMKIVGGVKSVAKLSLSGSAVVYFDVGEGLIATRPQVSATTSTGTLTPNVDNYSHYRLTAQAATLAVAQATGSPYDEQPLTIELRDDGTERAIAWHSSYVGDLPATTGDISVFCRTVQLVYNSARGKFVSIGYYDEPAGFATISLVGWKGGETLGPGTISFTTGWNGGSGGNPLEDDLVVISVQCADTSNIDMSAGPTGYTTAGELYANDTNDVNLAAYYRKMGSSPAANVTFDYGTAVNYYVISVWRGVDPSTPMDVTPTTATGTNTGSVDPASITPVTANALPIVAAGTTVEGPPVSGDLTLLTAPSSGFQGHGTIGYGTGWVSGAVNPAAWTGLTGTASDSWAAITMALRPKSLN